jgi:hypothetical protein
MVAFERQVVVLEMNLADVVMETVLGEFLPGQARLPAGCFRCASGLPNSVRFPLERRSLRGVTTHRGFAFGAARCWQALILEYRNLMDEDGALSHQGRHGYVVEVCQMDVPGSSFLGAMKKFQDPHDPIPAWMRRGKHDEAAKLADGLQGW